MRTPKCGEIWKTHVGLVLIVDIGGNGDDVIYGVWMSRVDKAGMCGATDIDMNEWEYVTTPNWREIEDGYKDALERDTGTSW